MHSFPRPVVLFCGIASLLLNRSEFIVLDGEERPSAFDQRVIFNLSGGDRLGELWEIGLKFRFASGRPYTPVDSTGDPSSGCQVVGRCDTLRLAPSHALDLRVDRRWPFLDWNLITYYRCAERVQPEESRSSPLGRPRTANGRESWWSGGEAL